MSKVLVRSPRPDGAHVRTDVRSGRLLALRRARRRTSSAGPRTEARDPAGERFRVGASGERSPFGGAATNTGSVLVELAPERRAEFVGGRRALGLRRRLRRWHTYPYVDGGKKPGNRPGANGSGCRWRPAVREGGSRPVPSLAGGSPATAGQRVCLGKPPEPQHCDGAHERPDNQRREGPLPADDAGDDGRDLDGSDRE